VQATYTTFSSLPWRNLFHLALQGFGTPVHLTAAKHFSLTFFLPTILLFAQQIKYSPLRALQNPSGCVAVPLQKPSKPANHIQFHWRLFTDPISLKGFHWKQCKRL